MKKYPNPPPSGSLVVYKKNGKILVYLSIEDGKRSICFKHYSTSVKPGHIDSDAGKWPLEKDYKIVANLFSDDIDWSALYDKAP